jgi:hypothetical protein
MICSGFVQPCSLTIDDRDQLYVVDTGNSRIKVRLFRLLIGSNMPSLWGGGNAWFMCSEIGIKIFSVSSRTLANTRIFCEFVN